MGKKRDTKEEAIEALKNSEEFYLLTYDSEGIKAGHWNFGDYAKVIGCLEVAKDWFKKEVLKQFS